MQIVLSTMISHFSEDLVYSGVFCNTTQACPQFPVDTEYKWVSYTVNSILTPATQRYIRSHKERAPPPQDCPQFKQPSQDQIAICTSKQLVEIRVFATPILGLRIF